MHRQLIAKHENERELQVARSIQMNLLPKAMPIREGFEFGGLSEPARMVGGDYFDFIDLPEDALALAIADVSGKGVPSAILLASLRAAASPVLSARALFVLLLAVHVVRIQRRVNLGDARVDADLAGGDAFAAGLATQVQRARRPAANSP